MGGTFSLRTGNSCSLGEVPANLGGFTSGTNGDKNKWGNGWERWRWEGSVLPYCG